MEKLLLVDGSNLLFQMFFGMPARIVNEDGKPIHGTLGFVGALLKIIRMVQPTHVAVLFDGEHENARISLDENYKANREDFSKVPDEVSPFSQLNDIYRALDYLEIRHAETTGCEADDWIAGYVRQYGTSTAIVIASMDSDFFQLVTERVCVLRYRGTGSVCWDAAYMRKKLAILPEQYADYKSLVGDMADNICGAVGVGPKTAAALLRQFGTLEGILQHAESIVRPSVRDSIIRSKERLRINYQLIHLEGNAAIHRR